jgi:hypothetical protein
LNQKNGSWYQDGKKQNRLAKKKRSRKTSYRWMWKEQECEKRRRLGHTKKKERNSKRNGRIGRKSKRN